MMIFHETSFILKSSTKTGRMNLGPIYYVLQNYYFKIIPYSSILHANCLISSSNILIIYPGVAYT